MSPHLSSDGSVWTVITDYKHYPQAMLQGRKQGHQSNSVSGSVCWTVNLYFTYEMFAKNKGFLRSLKASLKWLTVCVCVLYLPRVNALIADLHTGSMVGRTKYDPATSCSNRALSSGSISAWGKKCAWGKMH